MAHRRPDREPLERLLGQPGIDGEPSRHLDDEQLVALAEVARLDDADPVGVEHLSRCGLCRAEWIELRRGVERLEAAEGLEDVPWRLERAASNRTPRARTLHARRFPAWPALAAAALILAGVALLVPWQRWGGAEPVRSERVPDVLEPREPLGEVHGPLVFRWSELAGATTYEIVVLDDATGETVLRRRVSDDEYAPSPADRARLQTGREYRWLVRAERGVGRTSTGPSATFRIADRSPR